MLTEKLFIDHIEKMGYIPASPHQCVKKINLLSKKGQLNFVFYTNPHNLCWFVDDDWKNSQNQYDKEVLNKQLFTLNIRDFKLSQLNIL